MTALMIVGAVALFASTGSGARLLAQILFVFPLLAMFFGCAVWVGWNILTGFEHIDLSSFTTSAAIGCIPAFVMTSKF